MSFLEPRRGLLNLTNWVALFYLLGTEEPAQVRKWRRGKKTWNDLTARSRAQRLLVLLLYLVPFFFLWTILFYFPPRAFLVAFSNTFRFDCVGWKRRGRSSTVATKRRVDYFSVHSPFSTGSSAATPSTVFAPRLAFESHGAWFYWTFHGRW